MPGATVDSWLDSRAARLPGLMEAARRQAGAVSRRQALAAGLSTSAIDWHVRCGRWQRVYDGAYVLFSGPIPDPTLVWAALLRAGRGAALHRATALRFFGMTTVGGLEPIRLVVDHGRTPKPIEGVIVSRRRELARSLHPVKQPPTVRVEDAVLHEAAARERLANGFAVLADACQQRLTNERRLDEALRLLPRLRSRGPLRAVLADLASGAHSYLELGYLRAVERAHRLPPVRRQHVARSLGVRVWRDGDYPHWGVTLELDGRLGHEWARERNRDRRRDLVVAARGGVTLRHGYVDVFAEPCETAPLVAQVLASRGWRGTPSTCGSATEGRVSSQSARDPPPPVPLRHGR